MSLRLKRNEDLREGLQRVAERRLHEVLQATGQEGLTAEPVHETRKTIKALRAVLRLTRGALAADARQERNQALRDFAGRLSGPRDAAVTLAAFEQACRESLGQGRLPRWAAQVRRALASQAHTPVKAETFQDAAEAVRRLAGHLLPFEDATAESASSGFETKDGWESTVAEGLRKTYRQGRRMLTRVEDAPDEAWHELRKRVKDLGYQLVLLEKLNGVKALLVKLDAVSSALGDARNLSLLGDYLGKLREKRPLTAGEQQSYQRLLTHVDQRREALKQGALQAARQVYRHDAKTFTTRVAKRWRRWHRG